MKEKMKFDVYEIANLIIVILLLYILLRKRDVITLLLILLVYGTLHFSFAAIASITNAPRNVPIHFEGSGVLAMLSALILIGIVFVVLSFQVYKTYLLSKSNETIIIYIMLVMSAVLCGYVYSLRQGDWMQLKNVISVESALILILIGFLGLNGNQTLKNLKINSWCISGLVILGVADLVAIYEVMFHTAWAIFRDSLGSIIYRASSILFNPNLFSFWASLMYLGCAYGIHASKDYRNKMLLGMVLASIAIYFSGSRSAGYLLLGVLLIPALLLKTKAHVLSLMVLPLTMLTIYAGVAWVAIPLVPNNEGWQEIVLLGERFAVAPKYLFNYFEMHIGIPLVIPAEVTVSIEGRFLGEGRDAGWMVLYQDVGWLGLGAVIMAICMLVAWGVRAYIAHPSPSSSYALAALLYCILTGFVMRFQIFPMWLFIGLVIIVCMWFWRQLSIPAIRLRH